MNSLLLFLVGPFKANSDFMNLFVVSYRMCYSEIDTEFMEKIQLNRAASSIQESAKWSVEEPIYNVP